MREGIQGPLANCSLFSQTVFLARWTAGAKGASPLGNRSGPRHETGCSPRRGIGGVPGQTCGLVAVRREGPGHLPAVLLGWLCSGLLLSRRFPSGQSAGDGTRGGDGGPRRRSASSAGRDGPRTTQRPRRQDAAGARVPRSSRQCYCCARQRFIFMWRRTKYVASRAMIAASTTSTAVISGLCPNIPTVNVLEEFASV